MYILIGKHCVVRRDCTFKKWYDLKIDFVVLEKQMARWSLQYEAWFGGSKHNVFMQCFSFLLFVLFLVGFFFWFVYSLLQLLFFTLNK